MFPLKDRPQLFLLAYARDDNDLQEHVEHAFGANMRLDAALSPRSRIDALIARFFAVFDNRNGAHPAVEAIASCFTDKATIVRRSAAGAEIFNVEEFALPRIALLIQGALRDFHEWETDATTQLFDGIATRTSRYAKAGLLDGKDYAGAGTKCFQLVELDSGWRIAAMAWVDDPA